MRASPSRLRRNAKRREEFLARKEQTSPTTESGGDEIASVTHKCDQCEYVTASGKGLKQHSRMKHKNTAPASTPEIPRSRDESQGSLDCSISMSPLSQRREENCSNCDAAFSPVHQCEITDQGPWKEDAYPRYQPPPMKCGHCDLYLPWFVMNWKGAKILPHHICNCNP